MFRRFMIGRLSMFILDHLKYIILNSILINKTHENMQFTTPNLRLGLDRDTP